MSLLTLFLSEIEKIKEDFKAAGNTGESRMIGNKKRLVLVLPSAHTGGAEKVFLNLTRSLDRDLFEIHLVIINSTGPYLDLIPSDVVLHGLKYKRVSRAVARLATTLGNLKVDVVLSTIGHLNLALLLIKPFLPKTTKILVRESSIPSIAFATGHKNRLLGLSYRLLYPHADGIVCPGEAIKRDLTENFGIDDEKMIVIPNPVYLDEIQSRINEAHVSFQKGKKNLLAAGSLTRQKGFDLLVKVMARVAEKRPDVHLTILGEGPERKNIEQLIHSHHLSNQITLAGLQKNPFPYFYQADLLILSSRREGLPNVVLESLACGTPVVAFDCPGSVREIIDDPSRGTLVSAGNIIQLANSIEQRLDTGLNADKKSLLPPRFEAKNVIHQYERLLSA